MTGKYNNKIFYWLAWFRRERLRKKIAGLVQWQPLRNSEDGCTVIIGVCSRLPHVLTANLRCLSACKWPDLKQVIAVFDCEQNDTLLALCESVRRAHPDLLLDFRFYTEEQSRTAGYLNQPYVYAWLSWCIAIAQVKTKNILIHDYDALILGKIIEDRYRSFVATEASIQGIRWYASNGIEERHRLTTTFEAFVQTEWLRSLQPIDLFNKIGMIGHTSVDFDTTLEVQTHLPLAKRDAIPMNEDELVHPSQMIHQYTVFRRSPNQPLPAFSVVMIPFFNSLGGLHDAMPHAIRELASGRGSDLNLIGDGTRINLQTLTLPNVDWALKQMVQASFALGIAPEATLYRYGVELYHMVHATDAEIWRGDFTPNQRTWIDAASLIEV